VGEQGKLAVPLSMVSRLEEIDPKTVELSGNRPVVQYRDEIMPLLNVGEALNGGEGGRQAAREMQQRAVAMQVVVYSAEGRSVGLVVDEILDIVDQHVSISHRGEDERLLGSAVIQQHVTDLLNVPRLVTAMAAAGRVA
jgi:two-component system chemotaxis sensor kinase CheA